MPNKRIEALTKAAEKKKQEALKKTEKAIQTLVKQNHKITVRSVAREAGVSVSYIYKYPELTSRIQTLREQQKKLPVKPQSPSSKSHQIITTQLRNRIKVLEQEKEELNKEIKDLAANIYGMSKSENSLDRLKAENIKLLEENNKLKKSLRYTEKRLQESREYILSRGNENKSDGSRQNSASEKVIQLIPEENIVPAILPRQTVTVVGDEIDDEMQILLSELGIKLSKTLIKEIKEKPREQVMSAVLIVQENIDTGVEVRNKVGLFRSALKEE